MSTYSRIPENYDLRKIVEALIKELEEQRGLKNHFYPRVLELYMNTCLL
jgi:hypothetical protein